MPDSPDPHHPEQLHIAIKPSTCFIKCREVRQRACPLRKPDPFELRQTLTDGEDDASFPHKARPGENGVQGDIPPGGLFLAIVHRQDDDDDGDQHRCC